MSEFTSEKVPYRIHHLFALLHDYDQKNIPLDLAINHYFREHKALGSKDRGFIAETVYALVRWQGLLDAITPSPITWESRYDTFIKPDWKNATDQLDLPIHVKVSFPLELFQLIESSFGLEKAIEICEVSNTPAPTVVRANRLKITREKLLELWKDKYGVSPTSHSENGILFHKKMNFFELPEFKQGFFEVQDEGSQLLAQLVQAKPGELVLDYCSGSGGKTLAFAPLMEQKGQIYLHDIRPYALQEAKKRLKRAGIQNAQTLLPDSPNIEKLKKKMDWVLVDAPCTGTGTMRRNPDMKWAFEKQTLDRLIGQQRTIFEKALSFLKPSGKIVYGTCSVLKEENQNQLDHFIKIYNLTVEGTIFQSIPNYGEMDGFFGVVLKRT